MLAKGKGVSLGLEFHKCHRQNTLLWALLNLLLFQKEKFTIWTQLNHKAVEFQVPINLHFIETHPAYIKTETVKEIKHVWVTYSAGCSLPVLQNEWSNEGQFCYEVLALPRAPTQNTSKCVGKAFAPMSPLSLPSVGKLSFNQHLCGPSHCAQVGALGAGEMGYTQLQDVVRRHPTHLPFRRGSAEWRLAPPAPASAETTTNKSTVNQREGKAERYLGRRICLPVPIKLKCEAQTKAAGITLQRNRL